MAPYECYHMVTLNIATRQHYVLPHGTISHVSTHWVVINWWVGKYTTMPSLHRMYMYTPTSIQIYVHELLKFGPKTSWRHLNAFNHQVTQLFVNKTCATFCFILLIMKQFRNPKLWHIFLILIFVQMKQIKA